MNTVVSTVKTSPLGEEKKTKQPQSVEKQSERRAATVFCKVSWQHSLQLERSRWRLVLGSGVQKRYHFSGDLQQLPTKPKLLQGTQLKNMSVWDLVTLRSTIGSQFSLPGSIVLKAPYTSSCSCSQAYILRCVRGYWWSCYFHFWLKRFTDRAHILTVGDSGSKHFCLVWTTRLCASALHLIGVCSVACTLRILIRLIQW